MNFPTGIDDGTTLPNPIAGSFTDAPDHAVLHSTENDAIKAIEAKTGIGASTPVANTLLKGTGTGTSAWGTLTSANVAAIVTDETGSGSLVFGTSPALTGTPTAPTASPGANSTQVATTAYADAGIAAIPATKSRTYTATIGATTGDYPVSSYASFAVCTQAAIDAVSAAGGGNIFIRGGAYTQTAIINCASNVNIYGDPSNTIITTSSNYSWKVDAKANVIIDGLTINGNAMTPGNTYGVYIQNSTDITIRNCHFYNMQGFAVFVTASASNTTERIRIEHNRFHGWAFADTIGGGPANSTGAVVRNVYIDSNYISQDFGLGGTDISAVNFVAVYRVRMTNNICEGGILFGTEQQPHTYSVITGNTIKPPVGGTYAAVGLIVVGTATSSGSLCLITGNVLENAFIDVFCNISSPRFANVTVANNAIYAVGCPQGILFTNVDGGIINGNTVINSPADGILLDSALRTTVIGNVVRNSATYGAREINSSDFNNIIANQFLLSATKALLTSGTHTVMTNNFGPNPLILTASGNITGTATLDRGNGDVITATLTGNTAISLSAGNVKGDHLYVVLVQDATGGRTVTWPVNATWGTGGTPIVDPAVAATSIFGFVWTGSTWQEMSRTTSVGTVTSASVVSANGLAGTVATATTTPAITLSTTVTGILKGDSTAISAAIAGTDYLAPTGNGAGLTGITESQVTNLTTDLAALAPLASPAFTGTPTAPNLTVATLLTVSDTSNATTGGLKLGDATLIRSGAGVLKTGGGLITGAGVSVATTDTTFTVSMAPTAAKSVGMNRHTTANTIGQVLTIQSGGATSGATNKAAGNLVLRTGLSTGSGAGSVIIQTADNVAASTADNTVTTRATFDNTGVMIAGTAAATTFSGSGASLTSIPESGVTNLTSDLALKAPLISPTFTTPNIGTATANKLNIVTGSNASAGTAVLVAGTVTVSTTAITASSIVILTCQVLGTVTVASALTKGTVVAGTSFVINSAVVTDTSTIGWLIIN